MGSKEIEKNLDTLKDSGFIDKYGITGNTGLTGQNEGIIHLNANYSATEGYVFIEVEIEDCLPSWKRKHRNDVKPYDVIIKCHYCEKSAISLDHSWPWLVECTVCKEHHDKMKLHMLFKPIRKCRTVHECFYCQKDITLGQKYFDSGQKKRCHVNCKKKKNIDDKIR